MTPQRSQGKFVGNNTQSGQIPSDYANYWDQITLRQTYKQHTFVCGAEYPHHVLQLRTFYVLAAQLRLHD
jgi:hypothetical protein